MFPDPFEEDQRLGFKMPLERGEIIRFANVRYAGQPNDRTFAPRRQKFPDGDLELNAIGIGLEYAHVRLRRR